MRLQIRLATKDDIKEMAEFYRDTILTVNAKYYTPEQIQAWASTYNNQSGWLRRLDEHYFYVAIIENKIVGFATMDKNGYFDLLYVHRDHQKQGIATMLTAKLEEVAKELNLPEITLHASVLGRKFFERHGYIATDEELATVNGIAFTNTAMVKKLG